MIDPLAEPSFWLYNAMKPIGPVVALSLISLFVDTPRFHMLAGLMWGLVGLFALGFLMANPLVLAVAFICMIWHGYKFRKRVIEVKTVNVCLGGSNV